MAGSMQRRAWPEVGLGLEVRGLECRVALASCLHLPGVGVWGCGVADDACDARGRAAYLQSRIRREPNRAGQSRGRPKAAGQARMGKVSRDQRLCLWGLGRRHMLRELLEAARSVASLVPLRLPRPGAGCARGLRSASLRTWLEEGLVCDRCAAAACFNMVRSKCPCHECPKPQPKP